MNAIGINVPSARPPEKPFGHSRQLQKRMTLYSKTRSRQIIGCCGTDFGVFDVFIKQLVEAASWVCAVLHW